MDSYDLPPDAPEYDTQYFPPQDFHSMPSWTSQLALEHHVSCGEDENAFNPAFEPQRAQAFPYPPSMNPSRAMLGADWQYTLQQQAQQQLAQTEEAQRRFTTQYSNSLPQPSAADFATDAQATIEGGFPIYSTAESAYIPCQPAMDQMNPLTYYHHDLQTDLANYPIDQQMQPGSHCPSEILGTSPGDSSSDGSWQLVDEQVLQSAYINPSLTLHPRTGSDSSQENPAISNTAMSTASFSSFEEMHYSPSPRSEVIEWQAPHQSTQMQSPQSSYVYAECDHTSVSPDPSCTESSNLSSSPVSPNRAITTPQKKKKESKVSKPAFKKPSAMLKKDAQSEKKVGRRKGPLRPEQRQQAGEIRKLRACLRCKFLKKTCDKGDPCAGCKPSHARLWQVPCTRIDIKEIGYFMKDWSYDFSRHVTLGVSVANIRGYGKQEHPLWITHGYGVVLPISAREVYTYNEDDDTFNLDWTESNHDKPRLFEHPTARLAVGDSGIPDDVLSEYLDRHIDGGFEAFVDKHFEQTKFLTEMLKTAYHYYLRTKLPVIRKALKLVLAYNLTMHLTFVEGVVDGDWLIGKVEDPDSNFDGRILAPLMINFQVKASLANAWRQLHTSVLEEFQSLCQSVYNGARLKHWPTIFILAVMLLAVWEEMQFDSHYRAEYEEDEKVLKFCKEMESTPVGVIVGLFSAISQKVPSFQEWDTRQHHEVMNSDMAVCDTIAEVHNHVIRHQDYLKTRSNCRFERDDFDCLSNKFLSRLVIRAN